MILTVAHHWLGTTWNVYNFGYVDQPFNLFSLEAEGHRSLRCSNTHEQNTIAWSHTTHGMRNATYNIYVCIYKRSCCSTACECVGEVSPERQTSSTWSKCTRLSSSLFSRTPGESLVCGYKQHLLLSSFNVADVAIMWPTRTITVFSHDQHDWYGKLL